MGVIRTVEVEGKSDWGFDDAVRNAVAEAAEVVRNITGVEVLSMTADVHGDRVRTFRVLTKITFIGQEVGAGS